MRRRPRRRPPARCLGPSRLLASILVCARGKRLPYLGGVRPPRQSSFSSSTCTDLQGFDRALRDSPGAARRLSPRSEEHTSELQSLAYLVCRLLLEKKKKKRYTMSRRIKISTSMSS